LKSAPNNPWLKPTVKQPGRSGGEAGAGEDRVWLERLPDSSLEPNPGDA
jgi:hypothetical protein